MEWAESLRKAIGFMEKHLLEDIGIDDVADEIHLSSFYLQKGFRIMTGYSIGEYIRYRRLYMAALDIAGGEEKVIELAYKYGYDTPESFTKAFRRFHGISPAQLRNSAGGIHTFLPLKIIVQVQGGNDMDVTIEKMDGFSVIGFERECSFENSYQEIPKFWDEFCDKYCGKNSSEDGLQKVVRDYQIGEYGVCIDDIGKDGKFRYLIAGAYRGGAVPKECTLYEFPDMEWAKFRCIGPMPGALQSVNSRIFKEWIPGNEEYEFAVAAGANIEWYSMRDTSAADYESAIWIPVKRK